MTIPSTTRGLLHELASRTFSQTRRITTPGSQSIALRPENGTFLPILATPRTGIQFSERVLAKRREYPPGGHGRERVQFEARRRSRQDGKSARPRVGGRARAASRHRRRPARTSFGQSRDVIDLGMAAAAVDREPSAAISRQGTPNARTPQCSIPTRHPGGVLVAAGCASHHHAARCWCTLPAPTGRARACRKWQEDNEVLPSAHAACADRSGGASHAGGSCGVRMPGRGRRWRASPLSSRAARRAGSVISGVEDLRRRSRVGASSQRMPRLPSRRVALASLPRDRIEHRENVPSHRDV